MMGHIFSYTWHGLKTQRLKQCPRIHHASCPQGSQHSTMASQKSSNKAKEGTKTVKKKPNPSKKTKQVKNSMGINNDSPAKEPKQSPKSKKSVKDEQEDERKESKMCNFPMRRISTIAKSGGSDMRISQEALFLLNKASEKFLEKFCEDAYAFSVKDRKKSVGYTQLSSVVSKRRRYDFLSDFVPEKIKAEDALAERDSGETGAGQTF